MTLKNQTLSQLRSSRLPRVFFLQNTVKVAQQLLGKIFVVQHENTLKYGIISETEAYRGTEDLACHACHGKTPWASTMWKQPGTLYVYLIYGMYHCANIVTEEEGFPAAVLIRGVIPLFDSKEKTDGPGKFTRAFGITRKDNGLDLVAHPNIFIANTNINPTKIVKTPRIGVAYAKEWAKKPWRFVGQFSETLI